MEDSLRRCERMGETTTTMEAGFENGVLRLKPREGGTNKRRKVCSLFVDRKVEWSSENSVSPATSVTSNFSSRSGESSVVVKNVLDLKGHVFETDDTAHNRLSTETKPTTEMDSSSTPNYRISTVVTSQFRGPTAAEIDEFFSAAEKYQQEKFKKKYNFDVVKDVPLEGRYEWVPLKPCSQVAKVCEEKAAASKEKKIDAVNN